MTTPRRVALILTLTAALMASSYGAGWAWRISNADDRASFSRAPVQPDRDPDPTSSPEPDPTVEPSPTAPPEPEPRPELIGPGDTGADVRELQARLRQIDWYQQDVDGEYGPVTTEAVRGFQAKRGIPTTGYVDRRTLDRLHGMTAEPTRAELTNQPPPTVGGDTPGPLDPRCTTGRALCVDKSSNTLRWVVDGEVRKTFDARFGGNGYVTREGLFTVQSKSPDHVSSLYETSMPFAMFFSGGQAVHYSPDFAAVGYNGASHGCVNIRDYDGIAWLYDQVSIGDKVVVYWS